MPFRASNVVPAAALEEAKGVALRAKRGAQSFSTLFAQASTPRTEVLRCWRDASQIGVELQRLAAVPGLAAYAAEQESDPLYDVAAEFTALRNVVAAVVTEIQNTFPKDASGFLAVQQFGVGGDLVSGTFAAAQLATLRARLDAVVAQVA